MGSASFVVGRLYPFIAVILLGALVAVFGVACGFSGAGESVESGEAAKAQEAGEEPTALELVRVSERTTARAESSRFSMTMNVPGAEGVPPVALDFEGMQDFSRQESSFVMRMPMVGKIESRILGTKIYQKFPPEFRSQVMPPGKSWVVTDFEEQSGAGFSDLESDASNPVDQLSYLRSVGSVREVGQEEVRGASTTHYRAVIDLDKELASTQGGKDIERTYAQAKEQLGTSKLPTEVWLDEEGRVRRYEMNLPLPEQPATDPGEATIQQLPEGEMTLVLEYYDFGVPVEVNPPPPAQVMDVQELMQTQEPPA